MSYIVCKRRVHWTRNRYFHACSALQPDIALSTINIAADTLEGTVLSARAIFALFAFCRECSTESTAADNMDIASKVI